jgi:MSHA biogenesis protein MshL
VSQVSESRRVIDLGGSVPSITLPLARSSVSETDTIVRVPDGNIVAIGGLMSVEVRDNRSGLPGIDIEALRSADRATLKKELVILLKPTVIGDDKDWEQGVRESQERLRTIYPREGRKR